MKKFLLILVVLIVVASSFTPRVYNAMGNSTSYGNVDVDVLVERGVIQGFPDGSLHLERPITRAEFAKMLVKAFPYDYIPWFNLPKYSCKDLGKNFWASPYIETLLRAKVLIGKDNYFKPNDPILFEDAILALSKALKIQDTNVPDVISSFKDANLLTEEVKPLVNYFVYKGFYKVEGDALGVQKPLTRGTFTHILASSRFPVITILHTNDFHMYLLGSTDKKTKQPIGGSARIYTLVKNERAYNPDRTLLVDAGDAIGGGPPIGAFFYGKDVIEVYNAMGYNYATFGNHEFDWGKDLLAQRVNEAKYTYVCSNVIDTTTNSTFMSKPYDIKPLGFVKLGIFGVVTPQLPILVNPNGISNLEVKDPVSTATSVVSTLKESSDYIILLSHLGYAASNYYTGDIGDVQLASKVSGINLIIGGHTHTALDKPTVVDNTYIVQTGSYGNNLGRVRLYFETTANSVRLAKLDYKLLPVDKNVEEDSTISSIIKPYNDEITKKMSEVIGEALVDLDGSSPNIRTKETNLGDFISDWMREVAGADITITNGGGIRASIPKGPITVGNVYTTLPFNNLILLLTLKGSDVLSALENGFSQVEAVSGRFPQVSGIRVKVDLGKKPGSRVVEVKLLDGTPIDPNKYYTVATNDFMAAGGDGYASLKNATSIKIVTGNYMRDDLVAYIKAHPKVSKEIDGRITFVQP
ncbi:MAG: 5'-nucleotidase C-terminal domain-containing protein [Caldisericaceae bacterium]